MEGGGAIKDQTFLYAFIGKGQGLTRMSLPTDWQYPTLTLDEMRMIVEEAQITSGQRTLLHRTRKHSPSDQESQF